MWLQNRRVAFERCKWFHIIYPVHPPLPRLLQVIMVLENAENDFRALISRFAIQAQYEKAASHSKPLNVAWEIRKDASRV